jgi:hypothetical protein
MLVASEGKLISNPFTSSIKPGTSEAQKKKLTGVITKASNEENAVSVTDNATLPRASIEKKLETLPPGHAATNNIPRAIPLLMGNTSTSMNVRKGSRTI